MCAGPFCSLWLGFCLPFSYLGIHVLDKSSFCIMIFFCFVYQQIRHVIASSTGTHQHNYNHVGLSSPTRTPKNGKDRSSPHSSRSFGINKVYLSAMITMAILQKQTLCLSLPFFLRCLIFNHHLPPRLMILWTGQCHCTSSTLSPARGCGSHWFELLFSGGHSPLCSECVVLKI